MSAIKLVAVFAENNKGSMVIPFTPSTKDKEHVNIKTPFTNASLSESPDIQGQLVECPVGERIGVKPVLAGPIVLFDEGLAGLIIAAPS